MVKNKIIINIFSNWANFIILIIVGFFLTPFLIHNLGDKEYGIWILIMSIMGYMQLFKFGINTGLVAYISKFIETKDYDNANKIFNTGLISFLLLGLFAFFLCLLLAKYIPTFYNFENYVFIKLIFIIVAMSLAFEFSFLPFTAALSAKQMFLEINIISTTIFLLRTILIIVTLMVGYKLMALALIQFFSNIFQGILYIFLLTNKISYLRINPHFINKDSFKLVFNYTFFNFLMNISARVSLTGGILLVGILQSAYLVTFYSIANSLILYLHHLILNMQKVLIPKFSQLKAKNNDKKIIDNLYILTKYSNIIAIPIIFVYLFLGDTFIGLWVGEKYAILSGQILSVLAVGKLFNISQMAIETTLKGINKHRIYSIIRISEALTILVLGVLFIEKYSLIGMAYATAIPMIAYNLIINPIYACCLLKISIIKYYMNYILKNILAIIPLFLIISFFNYTVNINTLSQFIFISLTIAILFFAISFILILNLKDRQIIFDYLQLKRIYQFFNN
jgi:O-antigen/teichoic acid export membrane protein